MLSTHSVSIQTDIDSASHILRRSRQGKENTELYMMTSRLNDGTPPRGWGSFPVSLAAEQSDTKHKYQINVVLGLARKKSVHEMVNNPRQNCASTWPNHQLFGD